MTKMLDFKQFMVEEVEEALDLKQRRARAISMRKNKSKLAMGRRKAAKKIATSDVLKKRAQKKARNAMAAKLAKDTPKGEMTAARKAEIEKRLEKMKPRIDRMAKKMFKDVRKAEIEKKRGGANK